MKIFMLFVVITVSLIGLFSYGELVYSPCIEKVVDASEKINSSPSITYMYVGCIDGSVETQENGR